jgi:hypothetical protein
VADAREPLKASARIALSDASLVFLGQDDRIAHALCLNDDSHSPILRSVEADPGEPGLGPASPVFQETHLEKDDLSERLMAVGQWGKIHFSAVFLRSADDLEILTCGIAARVRQPEPIALASTYTIAATSSDIRAADESAVEVAVPGSGLILRIESQRGSRLLLAEAGRAALRLQVLPSANDPIASLPSLTARTVRWDYALRLVKPDTFV